MCGKSNVSILEWNLSIGLIRPPVEMARKEKYFPSVDGAKDGYLDIMQLLAGVNGHSKIID